VKRFIYNLTMTLLTPVILARLAGRGLKSPKYFARWSERFGWFKAPKLVGTVWVHAVSVGEFNAAIALIEALMKRYPDRQFVINRHPDRLRSGLAGVWLAGVPLLFALRHHQRRAALSESG